MNSTTRKSPKALEVVRPEQIIAFEVSEDACEIIYLVAAHGTFDNLLKRGDDNFLEDAQLRIQPLLTKRLIALAGVVRNTIFENESLYADEDDADWTDATGRIVGTLTQKGKKLELNFRAACDKLIHQKHMGFFNEKGLAVGAKETIDCAWVEGIQQGMEWLALIDIPQFAIAAYLSADEWCNRSLEE
jgi:hypothetical protein